MSFLPLMAEQHEFRRGIDEVTGYATKYPFPNARVAIGTAYDQIRRTKLGRRMEALGNRELSRLDGFRFAIDAMPV
jgi:hypothetical protein